MSGLRADGLTWKELRWEGALLPGRRCCRMLSWRRGGLMRRVLRWSGEMRRQRAESLLRQRILKVLKEAIGGMTIPEISVKTPELTPWGRIQRTLDGLLANGEARVLGRRECHVSGHEMVIYWHQDNYPKFSRG